MACIQCTREAPHGSERKFLVFLKSLTGPPKERLHSVHVSELTPALAITPSNIAPPYRPHRSVPLRMRRPQCRSLEDASPAPPVSHRAHLYGRSLSLRRLRTARTRKFKKGPSPPHLLQRISPPTQVTMGYVSLGAHRGIRGDPRH